MVGGPVAYEGADMGPAHEGLGITGADFDRVATYLDAALGANGVADGDREAVLEAVAALKPAVVEE